jgi:foldase protein PrsA
MNASRTLAGGLAALALVTLLPVAEGQADAEPVPAEPDVVLVQHVLIGFKRSVPNKKIDRTKEEAAKLAADLVERARAGEDFDALVVEHSADAPPGKYRLVNRDVPLIAGARKRDEMVPAFGKVAFSLEVGEVGLVEYSFRDSPYGWHVVKRLE